MGRYPAGLTVLRTPSLSIERQVTARTLIIVYLSSFSFVATFRCESFLNLLPWSIALKNKSLLLLPLLLISACDGSDSGTNPNDVPKSTFDATVNELNATKDKLSNTTAELTQVKNQLTQQSSTVVPKTTFDATVNELSTTKDELTNTTAELTEVKTQLTEAQQKSADRDQLNEKIQSMIEQNDTLSAKLDDANKAIAAKQDEIKLGASVLSETQAELETTAAQRDALQEQVATATKSLAEVMSDRDALLPTRPKIAVEAAKTAAAQQAIDALKAQTDKLNGDLAAMTSARDALQSQLETSQGDKSALQAQLAKANQDLADTTSVRDGVQAQFDKAKSDLADMTKAREALQTELDKANSDLAEKTTALAAKQKELDQATADLAAMTKARDDLQKQKDDLQVAKDQAIRDRDAANAKLLQFAKNVCE